MELLAWLYQREVFRWDSPRLLWMMIVIVIAVDAQLVSAHPAGDLEGLVVSAEYRCSHYDSSDYPYSQSVEDELVRLYGGVYSPYTGEWFASDSTTDIEHIVAKSEAHDSGLCAASAQTKSMFASDLLNLTLATVSVNRYQKSGKDAADWLPAYNQCWFADRVVQVKKKYGLTVDSREKKSLKKVISGCSHFDMIMISSHQKPPHPSSQPHTQKDPSSQIFANCTQLKRVYPRGVRQGHQSYQKRFDRDGDGHACE